MSSADDVLLGRAELERAFTALGERLVRRDVVADVYDPPQSCGSFSTNRLGDAITVAGSRITEVEAKAALSSVRALLAASPPERSARISPCCWERRMGERAGVGWLSAIRRILFSLRIVGASPALWARPVE